MPAIWMGWQSIATGAGVRLGAVENEIETGARRSSCRDAGGGADDVVPTAEWATKESRCWLGLRPETDRGGRTEM